METQNRQPRNISRKGFLVAILFVVVITGVTIKDALQSAHESANQRQCFKNLKELWSASMMYAQDYDGWMPMYRNDNHPSRGYNRMMGFPSPEKLRSSLGEYVKDQSSWFCPSDKSKGKYEPQRGCDHRHSSYMFLFFRPGMLRYDKLVKASPPIMQMMGDPHDFILISDDAYFIDSSGKRELRGIHSGTQNVIYLDGHIGDIKLD